MIVQDAFKYITVPFNNVNSAQSMVVFFAAVNHLGGPLRKQKFTSTGSKGHIRGL